MLELGMPTLIEMDKLEDCAAFCRATGLNFVELNMNLPQYQLDRISPALFEEIAQRYGIYYTVHLDENLNISDFNPYIAEGYLRTARETIRMCMRLNIPVINMHLSNGVYFTLPDRKVYLFSTYFDDYSRSIRGFRKLCEEEIGDSGIRICIENCGGFLSFQKAALEILLDSPVFGLTFDVGHSHCAGGLDEAFILKEKEKLHHMHLHDALGKKNHLPLGTGELKLDTYLMLAKEQNCRIVLETKTIDGLRKSIDWVKDKECTYDWL